MKRFLLSVVLATTLALTSCQFDDSDIWGKLDEYGQSIKDHEQRISALEELCKQMNTNIEALQTLVDALEKRDYVTNVSEVRSNGEVIGYTISFAYSDTITIYHGQDGKDGVNGADGKDGYTPQIGVMKDTDNIYYWTLDGEWLLDGKGNKIKAVGTDGADGKDGQDGANGTDGKDGQNGTNGSDGKDGKDGTNGTDGKDGLNGTDGKDGADGKDGITPQLKIENDYWCVSYDNGATWVQLGKATGEDGQNGANGADGENGKDGDSIFNSVTQDDEYVYFNLADGTMITLPKHDKENIQFEDLQVKAICCKNWDTNNDGELSYAEAAAVETIGTIFKGNTNIIAFTELKYFTGITEIPNGAFSGCTALWKIKIPENVLTIGSSAFSACKGMNSFAIPDSVTLIGEGAFSACSGLTSVTIPNSITSIGISAFRDCTSLKSIIIPDNVAIIGNYAFTSCTGLEYMYIGNGVAEFGYVPFDNCTGELFCNSNVPDANSSSSRGVFADSSFHKVTFGGRCTKIGLRAFRGIYSDGSDNGEVRTVVLEKSVTIISGDAFNVSSLDYVYCKSTIPPTTGSSFYSGLEKIYVPIGCGDKYKSASGWKLYASKIEEFDFENNSI